MSIIVAVKKDGAVYLGADTRTTCGEGIETHLLPSHFKIHRLGSCYVGATGRVGTLQILKIHPEWFELDGEPLTKRYLVREVVPKYYALLREQGLIAPPSESKKEADSESSFLVTDGVRVFRIRTDFSVIEEGDFSAIGCTRTIAHACFSHADPTVTPREQVLKALRASVKRSIGVGAPYVLVNTRDNDFEIVED